MGKRLNPCKCCGNLTIEFVDEYEICEICGWEDDDIQSDDPDYAGGANKLSLNQHKKKWEDEQNKK